MAKTKKKGEKKPAAENEKTRPREDADEIDFPTVVWSLVILAVLVLIHRLVWGG
ncbi:MAG: hypothetical protein JW958_06405 [Candidatus Eisenbacteria bacterium]|nr:hypothetical protein [Candidatus Eisenbacteria bacterium]